MTRIRLDASTMLLILQLWLQFDNAHRTLTILAPPTIDIRRMNRIRPGTTIVLFRCNLGIDSTMRAERSLYWQHLRFAARVLTHPSCPPSQTYPTQQPRLPSS
jgi:hypothetical protein